MRLRLDRLLHSSLCGAVGGPASPSSFNLYKFIISTYLYITKNKIVHGYFNLHIIQFNFCKFKLELRTGTTFSVELMKVLVNSA